MALFSTTFFATRLYFFPMLIRDALVSFISLAGFIPMVPLFLFLALVLVGMHLYWFSLIVKMVRSMSSHSAVSLISSVTFAQIVVALSAKQEFTPDVRDEEDDDDAFLADEAARTSVKAAQL